LNNGFIENSFKSKLKIIRDFWFTLDIVGKLKMIRINEDDLEQK
jgi:hypothetical protein